MSDIVIGYFEVAHTLGRAAYQSWAQTQVSGGTNKLLAQRHFSRKGQDMVVAVMAENTTLGNGAAMGTAFQVLKSEVAVDGEGMTNLAALMNASLSGYTAPATPSLSLTAAGVLTSQGTMYVKTTYVTDQGETAASAEASLAVTDNHELVVASPAAMTGASGWNVYIETSSGGEKKQNSTPIAIGTSYTLTAAPSGAGAAVPGSNGTACTKLQSIDFVPQTNGDQVVAVAVMSN